MAGWILGNGHAGSVAAAIGKPRGPEVETLLEHGGDVELTVTITEDAQTISGHVDGLQWYDGTTGRWTTYINIVSRIAFTEATIEDDGTFNIPAVARNAANDAIDYAFREGRCSGAFLEPHDDLEVAGWYMLASEDILVEGILGGFGAKQEPALSGNE